MLDAVYTARLWLVLWPFYAMHYGLITAQAHYIKVLINTVPDKFSKVHLMPNTTYYFLFWLAAFLMNGDKVVIPELCNHT